MESNSGKTVALFDINNPSIEVQEIQSGDQLRIEKPNQFIVIDVLLIHGKWIFDWKQDKRMWLMMEIDKWREAEK
jgi:hypothetical protein